MKKFKKKTFRITSGFLVLNETKVSDLKQLWRIHNQPCVNKFLLFPLTSFNHFKRRFLSRSKFRDVKRITAFLDGKVVGIITLRPFLGRASHVANFSIYLDECYWGMGIGRILMRELFKYAKDNGLRKIEDEVFSDNERALRFYKKLGFSIEGVRRKRFFRKGKYYNSILVGKLLT
ncbi:GNAT family N-acetyltransferase [Candidatus Micrarchaeota archaeon]|nr:GNAT family N-acetyltransferase [Candidatus Micrarchaeota archaeon]